MKLPVPERYFRKLRASERSRYLTLLRTLSPEDRRLRFMVSLADEGLAAYVDALDFKKRAVLGAFVRGVLAGAGEVVFEAASLAEGEAEVAISVDPSYQGKGLGSELTRRLVRLARNHGARTVWMYCVPENEPMKRIARTLGSELHLHGGEVDAKLVVSPSTPLSHLGEQVEAGYGLCGRLVDRLFAPLPAEGGPALA